MFRILNHQAERVAIVASGPSLRHFDLYRFADHPEITTIAVNGAFRYMNKPHFWFTLDPSVENVKIAQQAVLAGTKAIMAVPDDYGTPAARIALYKTPRIQGVHYMRRLDKPIGFPDTVSGLAEYVGEIQTGNSGFGALNAAYHMRPKKIGIFGVDGSTGYFYTGSNCRDLGHLPVLFDKAEAQLKAQGIKVVNGSPDSALNTFPKCSPEQALDWLLT